MEEVVRTRRVQTDIFYNGVDANIYISDTLSDFQYDDSTEESDSISITIGDADGKWSGAWIPYKGDKISAGIKLEDWEGEGIDQGFYCGEFIVDSFRLSGPPQKVVIEGVSSPVNLDFKETTRTQTWEKVTIHQIAAEIAARYGLTLVYDTGQEITLEREEQNGETDSRYLQELCNKYGMGIKVYLSQIIIWSYEEYEAQEPVAVIEREAVRKWEYKGSVQGTYTGARVSYTDPKKGKKVEAFIGREGRVLTVNEKAESVADAERIGKNALRNANRKEVTMELTLFPNEPIPAACTVRLAGFDKMDGIYFVTQASHRVSRKEYSIRLSLYQISADTDIAGQASEERPSASCYTVVKGDTLWDLAETFYQDNTKYTLIYEANREKIEAEAKRHGKNDLGGGYWIYPGTELTIPGGAK